MRERADVVAAAVRAVAPVGNPPPGSRRVPGYYRRRVKARGSRVHAFDPFWHLVEFGSINNPAYAPLRRGVIAAGLRFDPTPSEL